MTFFYGNGGYSGYGRWGKGYGDWGCEPRKPIYPICDDRGSEGAFSQLNYGGCFGLEPVSHNNEGGWFGTEDYFCRLVASRGGYGCCECYFDEPKEPEYTEDFSQEQTAFDGFLSNGCYDPCYNPCYDPCNDVT